MEFAEGCSSEISVKETGELKQKDVSDGVTEVADAGDTRFEGLSEAEQIERISAYINGLDEIKLENWEKLTLDERTNVLQQIENQTAKTVGREPMRIEVKQLSPGTRGETDWGGGTIRLNSNLVSSNNMSDLRQTMTTLAHEGRHAYQWSNLFSHRTETSDEKLDSWRVNIRETGYVSPYKMGYKWYYTQPVEVDARVFAEGVANKIGFR